MMFVSIAFAEEHPVSRPGATITNDVGVTKRVFDLEQFHFGVSALDVSNPRLSVQDNVAPDHAFRGRGNDQQRNATHNLSCKGMPQPVNEPVTHVTHSRRILGLGFAVAQLEQVIEALNFQFKSGTVSCAGSAGDADCAQLPPIIGFAAMR